MTRELKTAAAALCNPKRWVVTGRRMGYDMTSPGEAACAELSLARLGLSRETEHRNIGWSNAAEYGAGGLDWPACRRPEHSPTAPVSQVDGRLGPPHFRRPVGGCRRRCATTVWSRSRCLDGSPSCLVHMRAGSLADDESCTATRTASIVRSAPYQRVLPR